MVALLLILFVAPLVALAVAVWVLAVGLWLVAAAAVGLIQGLAHLIMERDLV